MAQNRSAPAFQEYAAEMMARTEYRVLSLAGRGLLYTVRLECWVNGSLPSDPPTLARVLSYPFDQVEQALAEIGAFLSIESGVIRCPELDDYRNHLDERRQKQSEGGRAGAAKTNKRRSGPAPTAPSSTSRVTRDSLVKLSPVQSSTSKSLDGSGINEGWVSDYERQSRGP